MKFYFTGSRYEVKCAEMEVHLKDSFASIEFKTLANAVCTVKPADNPDFDNLKEAFDTFLRGKDLVEEVKGELMK